MRAVGAVVGTWLALILAPPMASAALPEASCRTFDIFGTPATSYFIGQKIVVRGTGFAPRSLVLVSFVQGARTVELARLETNDLGAFSIEPPAPQLPLDALSGPAAIRVRQAGVTATCAISLHPRAYSSHEGFSGTFYVIWGSALGAFGVLLGVATWRGRRARRSPPGAPVGRATALSPSSKSPPSHHKKRAQTVGAARVPTRKGEPRRRGAATSEEVGRLMDEVRAWRRR